MTLPEGVMLYVVEVWRVEPSEGVQGSVSLRVIGGEKRYARIWDNGPEELEYGWSLHPTAVLIWTAEGYGRPDAASWSSED